MIEKGDRVRMKGIPTGHPEQDTGTVRRIQGDRARVSWDVCEATYWEAVEDLEVIK